MELEDSNQLLLCRSKLKGNEKKKKKGRDVTLIWYRVFSLRKRQHAGQWLLLYSYSCSVS